MYSEWEADRYRVHIVYWFSFFQGVVVGQQGPTFLDILIITNTDIETGAYFFTAQWCGYMIGSLVSGYLHGKVGIPIKHIS